LERLERWVEKMTVRYTPEFPDEYKQIIEGLMEKTGLRTQKDFFENTIALFGWAVREISRGNVIASLDEEAKTYSQIHMPSLMRVTPTTPPDSKSNGNGKNGRKVKPWTAEARELEKAHG
jgi:hypothetical protein